MKENVLDVLMYLFEHYLDDDTDVESDQESLKYQLVEAGFPETEISKAFAWLEGLAVDQDALSGDTARSDTSTRVFTSDEMTRLDRDCRGFILFLEQAGVLDSVTRELVVDRVMALETESIDLEHLKWVILMVLFNQPGREGMFAWMEDFVFDKGNGTLH